MIGEADLYRLIVGSKLETAAKFEAWVFEEVLPSIRKHGAYMTEQTLERALNEPDFLIQLATKLKEEKEKRKKAEKEAQLMSQRLQVVEGTNGLIPGTFWTLAYGTKGKNIFIRKLRQLGFLYKQSQRLTLLGEATNLLRNWNRPIPDTDRTSMTAVIIPGKEWEFFQFVETTPELKGDFEPIVNSREELEARVEEVRKGIGV